MAGEAEAKAGIIMCNILELQKVDTEIIEGNNIEYFDTQNIEGKLSQLRNLWEEPTKPNWK